jgi:hypothetical protein
MRRLGAIPRPGVKGSEASGANPTPTAILGLMWLLKKGLSVDRPFAFL